MLVMFAYDRFKRVTKVSFVADVPSPPVGPLGVFGIARDSLTLTWHEPARNGGSPVTGYRVECTRGDGAWTLAATADTTSAVVPALQPGQTYQFRIFAINEIGTSQPYVSDEKITIGKTLCKHKKITVCF